MYKKTKSMAGVQKEDKKAMKKDRKGARGGKYGKYQAVGADLAAKVKHHMDTGFGRVEISKLLAIPKGAVGGVMAKIKKGGVTGKRKRGAGRPRSARTPAVVQKVKQMVEHDPKISTTKIAKSVGSKRWAARETLGKDIGEKSARAVRSSTMNDRVKANRVAVCKEILKGIDSKKIDARKIAFSDEKLFSCGQIMGGSTQNARVWVDKSIAKKDLPAADLVVCKKRWAASVMVSVAISHKGTLAPHFSDRGVKITGSAYLATLENYYAPGRSVIYGGMKKFISQQDCAPAHTEKTTKAWMGANLNCLPWCASPPDLNPLDYSVWSVADTYAQEQKPKNAPELKIAVINAVKKLDQSTVQKAIGQFEKRLRMCVASDGDRFEYKMK